MFVTGLVLGIAAGAYFHNAVEIAAEFVSGQLLRVIDAVKGYFFTK